MYPTLSETLTGLALYLKLHGFLIHAAADWLRPERGRINVDTRQAFKHGELDQIKK